MKMMLMMPPREWPKANAVTLAITGVVLAFLFSGCGGGGDNPPPVVKETVTVTGKVAISAAVSPLQGAECRFVDLQGQEQGKATADDTGRYTLEVPADVDGEIRCTPTGFSNLALTTYSATRGVAAGGTLKGEDVTLFSTVAAQVIASEEAADPAARKAQVLAALAKGQDPDLNLVAGLSEKLYMALLHNNLDIDFSGSAAAQAGNGGISGYVRTGVDATPITGARCAFVVDGILGEGRSVLHAAALADFAGDGELSRPDLQAVQQQINADYDGRQQEIIDGLARVFPNGIGPAYTTFSDENGAYFLAVPAGLPGYVCCTPPDQEKMVLAAYVPGRAEGESLSGQDVTPATTVHSILIASPLSNTDVDILATRDNFLEDIAGLQIQMVQADNAVTGFELVPDAAPADREAGLAAFSATALFNTLYNSQLNVDFPAVLENFFQGRGLDPEYLTAQGVEADAAQACSAVVTGAVDQAEASLGTQLSHALSTARINVTVMDSPGGPALPGFIVSTGEADLLCRGCDTPTNAQGKVSLFLSDLSAESMNITFEASDMDGQLKSIAQTIQVVPLAALDILMVHNYNYGLDVYYDKIDTNSRNYNVEYDGMGVVTSHTGDIDCAYDPIRYLDDFGCSAGFSEGASITLTAVASKASRFMGWEGACQGTEPTCTLLMDRYRQVGALFSPVCDEIRAENFYNIYPLFPNCPADGEEFFVYDAFPRSCGELTVSATTSSDWIAISEIEPEETEPADYRSYHLAVNVSANPDAAPRTGTILYNGSTITVFQDGQQCAVSDHYISPSSSTFESAGGTGTFQVRAPAQCQWSAVTENDWITLTSGATGASGNGTVTYAISENISKAGRIGIIHIGGTQYVVAQNDASANSPVGLSIHGEGDSSGIVYGSSVDMGPPQFKTDGDGGFSCLVDGAYTSGKCNMITLPGTNVYLTNEIEVFEVPGSLYPDWNSIFTNWTGSCSESDPSCNLTMDRFHTVGARFVVPRLADLMVDYFYISSQYLSIATPIQLLPHEEMYNWLDYEYQLCLKISNWGGESASSFSIGLYISADDVITTDDTILANGRISVHGVGAKFAGDDVFEVSFNPDEPDLVWIPSDLPPGPAYLGVIVDEFNEISEETEINNTYSTPVYLVPSD